VDRTPQTGTGKYKAHHTDIYIDKNNKSTTRNGYDFEKAERWYGPPS